MIKILQFGEGNFLRTFVDAYFSSLNKGNYNYRVDIIKPIPFGSIQQFAKQQNKYHIVLRGMEDGQVIERVHHINCVNNVISPFEDMDAFYQSATDADLKLVISNTTEAGICFNANDKFDDFANITFPAKLTKFLLERYNAKLAGVYLLPVELIENNADELYRCVNEYAKLWNLPQGFVEWNNTQNYYCNTLVDRIVSGFPRDEQTKEQMFKLVGCQDNLLSIGEPFGLWAIENKGEVSKYIVEGKHNIEVILTNDIAYYKKRKVRVLNGSHTNLVPAGLVLGQKTVYDCMVEEKLHAFFQNALEEIIPFVSNDANATRQFANDVEQRFFNPFLNHQLTSIALNSISKWKARVLPTFKDYYHAKGVIPKYLTIGFAYLMYLYQTQTDSLQDDAYVLQLFKDKTPLQDLMQNANLWGEDLTQYDNFYQTVAKHVKDIAKGKIIL